MSDWRRTGNRGERKDGRTNMKALSTGFIPVLPESRFCVCTSLTHACVRGGLSPSRFHFVAIYFWPAISLMHQPVKATCELACQRSLCISVKFFLPAENTPLCSSQPQGGQKPRIGEQSFLSKLYHAAHLEPREEADYVSSKRQ